MRRSTPLLLSAVTALILAVTGSPALGAAGDIHVVKFADSSFDRYTSDPGPQLRGFIRERYTRMVTFAPYFDSRTSWYPGALAYQDLYAIYADGRDDVARRHPEWILRDARGRRLYIPFGCDGRRCPQYAGDPGNPQFRRWWIARARTAIDRGYRGIYVDDVNMERRVGDAAGNERAPIDPRTRRPMTEDAWRRHVADFTVEIRRSLPPTAEIQHNAIWYAGPGRDRDPHVRRQLAAADVVNLERGVNDTGLTGGDGPWSLRAFLGYIDRRHADGTGVVLHGGGTSAAEREYELGGYLLVSNGHDAINTSTGTSPGSWWRGFNVSLGSARGRRYEWNGLLRRDFEHGTVLLNEPDAPAREITVPPGLRGLDGRTRSTMTLGPKRAVVLASPAVVAAAASR